MTKNKTLKKSKKKEECHQQSTCFVPNFLKKTLQVQADKTRNGNKRASIIMTDESLQPNNVVDVVAQAITKVSSFA